MDSFCIPEPSLSSRAMLCSLSISMWSARKHDRDASEEIAVRHVPRQTLDVTTNCFFPSRH
jgi:hypothetical protein